MQMYERILVTLDGSEASETALPHMETVYKGCEKPKVTLLRVVEPVQVPSLEPGTVITSEMMREAEATLVEEAKKYLKDVSVRLNKVGIPVTAQVIVGKPADTILDYISKNDIDLLIMSSHGHSGVTRWVWGSVADRILHHACIPITLIRAQGCGPMFKSK
jgi:nucleotide-binding universal stress UspA family protein